MPIQVIALIYVLLMAGGSAGIAYLLVINDFFLPKFLRARTVRGSLILSAAWVLAVAATVFEAVSAGLRWSRNRECLVAYPLAIILGLVRFELDNMGNLARAVVILLAIMSIWSLAVIIDRALYFSSSP